MLLRLMLPSAKRKHGEVQPHIPLGIFKVRFPFVHYAWEIQETIQSLAIFVTAIAAIAFIQDNFYVTFTVALGITIFHDMMYCLHQLFGDIPLCGWITPSIPLTVAFLQGFDYVGDRMDAMIAVGFMVALIFLVLGISGLGHKMATAVPNCIKAGILIGAGILAVAGTHGFSLAATTTGLAGIPWSWSAGVGASLFILFARGFKQMKASGDFRFANILGKAGFIPALAFGGIVGVLAGEIRWANLEPIEGAAFFVNPFPAWGWTLENFSMIGRGFPPLAMFGGAAVVALMAYTIAYGDIILAAKTIEEAQKARPDEKLDHDINRSHIIVGFRNTMQFLFNPMITLSGPLWAGPQIAVTERYKSSTSMHSLIGGTGTFNIVKLICLLIAPLIMLVQPLMPLAMALTMMIAGFACFYMGLSLCATDQDRGIAGLMGVAIFARGPFWGLVIGFIVTVIVNYIGYSRRKAAEEEKKNA